MCAEPESNSPTSSPTSLDTDAPNNVISEEKQRSLEEKMKSWEATPEEIKAATLGGMVPKSDGFNITLWILFVPIVGFGLLFAVFPFIMGSLDVTEFGPPPTV
ncbi:hypothetical protein TrVE_jg3893 [Triparma verrucosa]|nr:hypothetical protein TrVE_jg3893 [Triparma verrucosa]